MDATLSGGVVRSVCCKANYLADVAGYDVTILTTDRRTKDYFYQFSDKIKFVNLGINYTELDKLPFFERLFAEIKKRRLHRSKLIYFLLSSKPDLIVSTYMQESSILAKMKITGSKIVEVHTAKIYQKLKYSQTSLFSLKRFITLLAEKNKQSCLKKYDTIVVLNKTSKSEFRNSHKVEIIPDVTPFYPNRTCDETSKRVICVGELTYTKGHFHLIEAWDKVSSVHPDWKLSIFGDGEDWNMLKDLIVRKGLSNSVDITLSTASIEEEYLNSSLCVMPSLTEGFGLVLIEAMSCGLACVSFNSPTGPSEVITHGEDGLLVENKNSEELANAILFLIEDKVLREEMGRNARENARRFLPDRIMPRWITLFEQVTGTSEY